MKLHNLIFLGMVIGALAGLALHWVHDPAGDGEAPWWYEYTLWTLDLLGPTLFRGMLLMIIAPLIFSSIIAGVTSLPNVAELGAIGWKTITFYVSTTTVAVLIGLLVVSVIRPGDLAASQQPRIEAERQQELLRAQYEAQAGTPPLVDGRPTAEYRGWLLQQRSQEAATGARAREFATMAATKERGLGSVLRESLVQPILTNPFVSLASTPPNALGIIFFGILMGIACTAVGPAARPLVELFQAAAAVMMRITHWIMLVAPLAVGCLVAKLVAETGPGVFASLGWYCVTVVLGIALHVTFLFTVARTLGGVSPLAMFRGIREAMLVAISTRSSAATLPVTISNVTRNLGVSPKVANFSLPIGATINMDGTALYQAIAVVFLVQLYGGLDDVTTTLGAGDLALILITAVLASVGAAAVPSAGLVTMVIVAAAVDLPIYYLTLIFATDAVLDMLRTATNVFGDSVGGVVINRLERSRLGDT